MRYAMFKAFERLFLLEVAAAIWFAGQAYFSKNTFDPHDFLTTLGDSYREFALVHVVFLVEAIHRFGKAAFGPLARPTYAPDNRPASDDNWLQQPSHLSTNDTGLTNPSTSLPMVGNVDTSGHRWEEN
jgi:hypothetical protein